MKNRRTCRSKKIEDGYVSFLPDRLHGFVESVSGYVYLLNFFLENFSMEGVYISNINFNTRASLSISENSWHSVYIMMF